MTQRSIEMVVGRLMTDEEFRRRFSDDPHQVLGELLEWGTHLTPVEMAALIATDSTLWERIAEHIDPRLQKANSRFDNCAAVVLDSFVPATFVLPWLDLPQALLRIRRHQPTDTACLPTRSIVESSAASPSTSTIR